MSIISFMTSPHDTEMSRREAEEREAFYKALPFGLPQELLAKLRVEICSADDRCQCRCSNSGCESYRFLVSTFLETLDKAGWKVVSK